MSPEDDILAVASRKEEIVYHPAHLDENQENTRIKEGLFDHPTLGTGVWRLKSILKGRGYSILVSLYFNTQDFESFFLLADDYLKTRE